MKKSISILLLIVMIISLFTTSAFADYNPYEDDRYYKENVAAGHLEGIPSRNKTTTSKVYVLPQYSPSDVTLVQTICYVNGNPTYKNVNGVVSLISGTKYGITNRVYEDGDRAGNYVCMWLGVAPATFSGRVEGLWSPDWTGTGNVEIV